jgi:glucokinase
MKNNLDVTGLTCLTADIGGTNVRFGVVNRDPDAHGRPLITEQMVYPCSSFDSIDIAMETYLDHIGKPLPEIVCMAVAGPVKNNIVRMTNREWLISGSELTSRFGFREVMILNDAAAIAYATRVISDAELKSIKPGCAVGEAPAAVIAAGTGIGVAAILPFGDRWHPVSSEAGHISLSPRTARESVVFDRIAAKANAITAELLLSGEGIRRLYFTLADVAGTKADDLSSREVTQLALDGEDDICVEVIDMYSNLLGGFAGDIALMFGARGGVYLAGKVMRQIEPVLSKSPQFRERFENKGPIKHFMTEIPVDMIALDEPGLLGASAWLDHSIAARTRVSQ